MSLADLKKLKKKKKTVKKVAKGPRGGGGGSGVSDLRPRYSPKTPPCVDTCPAGNQIRSWLTIVQHTEKLERTFEQSMELAWHAASETTPFPAACGRVCPHPCESACNRKEKDEAVSINCFERFIGDWGIEHGFAHKKLTDEVQTKKVAVIGAGPAGLTCAQQLARRGYPVTVFEAYPHAGGMLRYGIPPYRLPRNVLDAEIQKIVDMGVDLRCNTVIGKDQSLDDIQAEYDAVYLGIGAHQGIQLRIEGEDAENVWTGVEFLKAVNSGDAPEIGNDVAVIGGGNSAIDAARVSKRLGAQNVTILYRRTRDEMPAIAHEIDEALAEGIDIQMLTAPVGILTEGGKATGVRCIRMELGEPDDSGRRRPVPVEGSEFDVPCSALIPAISQRPEWLDAERFVEGRNWFQPNDHWALADGVFAGGDAVNLDLVTTAIGHGRKAAEYMDDYLQGIDPRHPDPLPIITHDKMRLDHYDELPRNDRAWVPHAERFGDNALELEVDLGITQEQFIAEANRCMSCGQCFWCEKCWMYCQSSCVQKGELGEPYTFKLDTCDGCKKCAEECPCGYIDLL